MPNPQAILATAQILSDPKTQKKANQLIAYIEGLICRVKGSCSPKFSAVIAQIGIAGYRRGTSSSWSYYLHNGIHLTQDLTKFYNAQNWYFGSGYWEKFRNAGLDNCCLKQKWPPTEAFPLSGKPLIISTMAKLPNGLQFEVDPERFDPTTYQMELDDFFKRQGGVQELPKQTPTITPNVASGTGLLPLLLIAFALKGGG